ncbi:MAG: fibro-slime domain-containing protein [Phycisphaerales bacterium]|nr:MAG: fibro-slime domain-containing protein [Phycisphaerales bacterium]
MQSHFAINAATYLLLVLAGGISLSLPRTLPVAGASGPAGEPDFLLVRGVVRDFNADHPDFNVVPGNGYGHYCGNIDTTLGEDGKPVFVGGGFRVAREWRDSKSRHIAWCMHDASRGDNEGNGQKGEDNGAITSAETFAQWFRDVPGVNQSTIADITMTRGSDGIYRFATNNFFPIDDTLLGDEGDEHNYHFTFELVAEFVYDAGEGQVLRFMGDDDIWVFIDGRLVIDLGGVAGNTDQFIDLNRLGLEDGKTYRMHFFHAERHQPKSQWRFATNILLDTDRFIPSITSQFD